MTVNELKRLLDKLPPEAGELGILVEIDGTRISAGPLLFSKKHGIVTFKPDETDVKLAARRFISNSWESEVDEL